MKGFGWIFILLALLTGMYIVAKDMNALTGERDGKVVVEPLEQAKETANKLEEVQKRTNDQLKKLDQ